MSVDVTTIYKYGELHPDTPLWNGNNTEYIYWVHWNWNGIEWYQYSRKPFYVSDNVIIMYRDTKYMKPNGTEVGSNTSAASVSISEVTIYKSSHEIPGYTKNIDVILWKPPLVELSCSYTYPYVRIDIANADTVEEGTKFAIFRSLSSEDVSTTGEKIFESTDFSTTTYTDKSVSYGNKYYYQLVCYDAEDTVIWESAPVAQITKVCYKFTNGGLTGPDKLTQDLVSEMYANTSLEGLVTWNGDYQVVTLPSGTYQVAAYGAKGGDTKTTYGGTFDSRGGKGYYVEVADVAIDGDLYIQVGNPGVALYSEQSKANTYGGGGGIAKTAGSGPSHGKNASTGGGASSISTDGTLETRILVAAGGGGAGWQGCTGADGGLLTGANAATYGGWNGGSGATQKAGGALGNSGHGATAGSFGLGGLGSGNTDGGGGGGGGYYGGGGACIAGGGGGSSYTGDYAIVDHGVTTEEPCVIFYQNTEPDPTLCPPATNFKSSYNSDTRTAYLTWDLPLDDPRLASIDVRLSYKAPVLDIDQGTSVYQAFGSYNTELELKLRFDQYAYISLFTLNSEGRYTSPARVIIDTWRTERIFPKVFKSCGAQYNIGPTAEQIATTYQNTPLADLVTGYAGIQRWEVPVTGKYQLTAIGASGGCGGDYGTTGGGVGASLKGTVSLNKGQVLYLLVGQKGQDAPSDSDGGGGGASFIVLEDSSSDHILDIPEVLTTKVTPLLIAGGGGAVSADSKGNDASLTENSTGNNPNTKVGYGCTHGNGSGGGGFLTGGRDYNASTTGGKGFLQGGAGGIGSRKGGFGGGAGGYDENGSGGGGYTGGPGYDGPSGGGGSYFAPNIENTSAALHTAREDGLITINLLEGEESGFLAYNETLGAAYYDPDTAQWVAVDTWAEAESSLMETLSYEEWQAALELGYQLYKVILAFKEEVPTTLVGLPLPGVCSTIQGYSLHDKQIIGLTIEECSSEVRFLFSTDGNTWKVFTSDGWAASDAGMNAAEIQELGRPAWDALSCKDAIYIKALITPGTYTAVKVQNIKMRYIER